MHKLASEFHEVLHLCIRLVEDLARIMNVDESKDPQALVKSILENQSCLLQIQKMNSRVLNLHKIWEQCRRDLDPATCEEIRKSYNAASAQALRLQEICGLQVQRVQARRDYLAKELAEIGNGTRYLKALKPAKNNYPKFIDSAY